MANTANCPAAKGGTNAARPWAASKAIRMRAHLHEELACTYAEPTFPYAQTISVSDSLSR